MESSVNTEELSEQGVELGICGAPVRSRNARGEGNKLRDDILDAARHLLEGAGSRESVTLRAIAREVGIAAPSIYRHFPDREAIIRNVEALTYKDLESAIEESHTSLDDPVDQLVAGCLAYAEFALENPGRYRILFNQLEGAPDPEAIAGFTFEDTVGLSTFQLLIDGLTECIKSGQSKSTDAFADSSNIWASLHGLVTLHMTACLFPWRPLDVSVRDLVCALGRIS